MELHHNEILAGHNGVSNTFETLKVRYYFKGMYQKVKDFISSCETCQERKDPIAQTHPMKKRLHTEYAPFAYISMDIKTMYPSRSGHNAILVCVDEQTHFMVCYPLKKGDSSIEIAEILTQELFHTYSQPKEITMDMDPKFKNKLFECVHQRVCCKSRDAISRR